MEHNENGNGKCPSYLKDPKFWMWCVIIIATASVAWATLNNNVSSIGKTVEINSGRINKIESALPEINEKLSIIQTDVAWMKRNLK